MNELAKRLRDTVVIVDEEAIEIGDLDRRGRASFVDSVRCLIEAGHRLTAKKNKSPHGEWLPWLAANADALGFEIPRTAQHLMVVASKYDAGVAFEQSEAVVISRLIWGHGDTAHLRRRPSTAARRSPAMRSGTRRRSYRESAPRARRRDRPRSGFQPRGAGMRPSGEIFQQSRRRPDARVVRPGILNLPYAQPDIELFIDKLIGELAAFRVTAAIRRRTASPERSCSAGPRGRRRRYVSPPAASVSSRPTASVSHPRWDILLLRRRRTEIRGGLRRRGRRVPGADDAAFRCRPHHESGCESRRGMSEKQQAVYPVFGAFCRTPGGR